MSKSGLSMEDLQKGAKSLNHASVKPQSKLAKGEDDDQDAISALGEASIQLTLWNGHLINTVLSFMQNNYIKDTLAISMRCE